PGSSTRPLSRRQLHGRLQVARVLLRDAQHSRSELAAEAGAQRDRRAVGPDGDLVAAADAASTRILFGELDLRLRPLELQLRYALDRRTGEERAVAHEAQTVTR